MSEQDDERIVVEMHREWADEQMKKNGWIAHYIIPEEGDGLPSGMCNYHTHGFAESWRHPDLQIVITLRQEVAHDIFWNVANRVKGGERFQSGQDIEGIVGKGYKIRFAAAVEARRPVLRLLIPDVQGRFPGDEGCGESYSLQADLETDRE